MYSENLSTAQGVTKEEREVGDRFSKEVVLEHHESE